MQIPSFTTYSMNTKSLKYIVPEVLDVFRLNSAALFTIHKCLAFLLHFIQLYKKFPDTDLVLAVDVEKPPVTTISPGGIAASIPGQIAVYAKDNGTQHYVFTLGLVRACVCLCACACGLFVYVCAYVCVSVHMHVHVCVAYPVCAAYMCVSVCTPMSLPLMHNITLLSC